MRSAWTIAAITLALATAAHSQRRPHHPIKLSNGKDLSGWEGEATLWSVVDGVITGVTDATGERKIEQNSFLTYKARRFEDFELTLSARVSGDNNSGIQYRSNLIDPGKAIVSGYQLDLNPRPNLTGMVYEEGGRGVLAQRGATVLVGPGDQRQTLRLSKIPGPINIAEWNDYTIVARGNRLVHKVNGQTTATVIDDDVEKRSLSGVIALQLHSGAPMKLEVKNIVLRPLARIDPAPPKNPTPPVKTDPPATPQWIWASDQPEPGETVYFRRPWNQKQGAVAATLTISCDDSFTAYLNGIEIGNGDSWRTAYDFDLTARLVPNFNTLAIRSTNLGGTTAGLAVRLATIHEDGSTSGFVSDHRWVANAAIEEPKNWTTQPESRRAWRPSHVIGEMGIKPWGDVFAKPAPAIEPPPAQPSTLPGYKLEKIFEVDAGTQGSWVALTRADHGRLIAAAQGGSLFYIDPAGAGGKPRVEKIDLPIGHAHGLLWAFDSLYVCVNGPGIGGHSSGLYRVVDASGDGKLDTIRTLKKFESAGELGPHGVILGPDPVSLYVVCGRRTSLPEPLARSHPARLWGDDQLLLLSGDQAPAPRPAGAWICKTRPDGREWILHSVGHRNPYDIALDHHGNLFTSDADSPSDRGLPGFRPAGIYHVPEGADFGFREGLKNFPTDYPDTLPPTVEIAPGSPTGISFGYGAAFPARYQEALFACDWTRSAINSVHLSPDGASYSATSETFVSGAGLRVTDLTVGEDGALYFVTGGRTAPSALWRVTYTGEEKTTPFPRQPFTPNIAAQHDLRTRLGNLQDVDDPRVIATAWRGLSHPDRFVRNAARTVIEHHDPKLWLTRFEEGTNPTTILEAAIAITRVGEPEHHETLAIKLAPLRFDRLTRTQKIAYLRARGLACLRLTPPSDELRDHLIAELSPRFPSGDEALDVELCRLLIYLGAPDMIDRTLALMPDSRLATTYATFLATVKDGWTAATNANYLEWLRNAASESAGANFPSYLKQLSESRQNPADHE